MSLLAAGEVQKRQAEVEAADEELAKSVGMHIRGSNVIMDADNTDEDSEERFYWHR